MLTEVKKCADAHDIKGLRYIFVDCLDVDPTFEKYKSDYEYCKQIDGFLEKHQDLTNLTSDETEWTLQYWEQLKLDLMKNFSETRFEHMIQVTKIVYAGKIARLSQERKMLKEKRQALEQENQRIEAEQKTQREKIKAKSNAASESTALSEAEIQEQRIAEKKRTLEQENQRIEAEQKTQWERIETARKNDNDAVNKPVAAEQHGKAGSSKSKKVQGIAIGIAAVIAVALIAVVLR